MMFREEYQKINSSIVSRSAMNSFISKWRVFYITQFAYRATITSAANKNMKKYLGLADASFKEGHSDYKRDFKHQKCRNYTELTKYIWEFNENSMVPIIKWEILNKASGKSKQDMCIIYLTNKL